MPLHYLYSWMDDEALTLDQIQQLGIDRAAIKDWREYKQHSLERYPISLSSLIILASRSKVLTKRG